MHGTHSSLITTPLLRPESIKAASSQLGAPVRLAGVSEWVLSIFFLSLLSIALIFICTTNYARKETVAGQVTATNSALRIVAPRNGAIQQLLVEEGQTVHAGQKLMVVSYAPKLQFGESISQGLQINHQAQIHAQAAQIKAKRQQLTRQQEETRVRQQGIDVDIVKLIQALELQEQRVALQEQTAAAMSKLAEQGLLTKLSLRVKEEELIAARQNASSIEREIERQKNLSMQLTSQLKRLLADEQMIQSDGKAVEVQMAEKRLNTQANYEDHLTSPTSGIITALQAKKGAPINGSQTLAVIVPIAQSDTASPTQVNEINSSGLEVELWAPSRAIGFVKPGNKVRIMYESFPYQHFGVGTGIVRDVARAPTQPNELPIPNTNREQLFRIRVNLTESTLNAYGRAWALSPGMTLSADLVLEERSLLDWLLEPLLALKKRAG